MSADALTPEMRRAIAAWIRGDGPAAESGPDVRWADALDPRPSLRDAVARAMHGTTEPSELVPDAWILWVDAANAALAVVRDHIAALPIGDLKPWEVELLGTGADVLAYRTAVLADLGAES